MLFSLDKNTAMSGLVQTPVDVFSVWKFRISKPLQVQFYIELKYKIVKQTASEDNKDESMYLRFQVLVSTTDKTSAYSNLLDNN